LNYLRALPIDALKIDRTFVKDIAEVSSNRAIVSAIVAMGHSLDLKVVVEGIETNEQLCYLWALDCDEWQGYLFSPAVKWEEFEEYLNSCKEASAPGVSWTPELSVHVDKIDDQHKVWCERVNTLYKSVWSGVKVSELREFAGFLSDYARLHFSDEEALMMAHDYPKYDEHKSAHRVLLNKIQLLKQRIAEENITAELVSDLLQELQNWFLEHIRQVDRELGEFIGQGSAKPGLSVVDISPGTDPLVK
jgi:hemerythrin-like metal-binding protein